MDPLLTSNPGRLGLLIARLLGVRPPPPPAPPALSIRAQKLYQRLLDGEFYPAYSDRTPQAMKELTDEGLVSIGGRVVTIAAFFVPSETVPFKPEQIKGRPL